MIRVNETLNLEGSGLFIQDGVLRITKKINDFLVIEEDITINVEADSIILDISKGKNIKVNILNNSNVNYQILNSHDTKREFKINGNLNITQIALDSTTEELVVDVLKENVEANVELLSIGNGFNMNFVQKIIHKNKMTSSNISNFGVSVNGSNIVFDTTGKVEKGMAKSHCVQLSKGIVMDDDSSVTSKPILLIDEYDVVANHGASIGKMSDESLFYLMSRGLSKKDAFLLILEGIIRPFTEKVIDEDFKSQISSKLELLIKR